MKKANTARPYESSDRELPFISPRTLNRPDPIHETRQEFYSRLHRLTEALHSSLDKEHLLQCSVTEIPHALFASAGAIGLIEGSNLAMRHQHLFPASIEGLLIPLTEGTCCKEVLKSQRPYVVDNIDSDSRFEASLMEEYGARSLLLLPLVSREEVIGILFCLYPSDLVPSIAVEFAYKIQTTLTNALTNARLYQDAIKAKQEIHAELKAANHLLRASETLVSSLDLEYLLDSLTDVIHEITGCDRVAISLIDSINTEIVVAAHRGLMTVEPGTRLSMRELSPQFVRALENKRTVLGEQNYDAPKENGPRSLALFMSSVAVLVPIVFDGDVIGMIGIDERQDHHCIPPAVIRVLEGIAAQAAVAIENAKLYYDRQMAEEQLWQANEKMTTVLESITDAYIAFDSDLRIVEMNTVAAEKVLGRPEHELKGKLLWEEYPGASEAIFNNYRKAMREKRPVHFESTAINNKWFEVHAYPRNSQLEVYFRDINERKLAEETLRESEEKYRQLVQDASSIILKTDNEGNVTFLNEFAQQFFGFKEEEIIGKNILGTIVPPVDPSGTDPKLLLQSIFSNPDAHRRNENENMRKDGERVWVSWTNRPILNINGDAVGLLRVGQDITERKKVEKERELLFEAAEEGRRILNAIMTYVPEGIAIVDKHDGVIHMMSNYGRDLIAKPKKRLEKIPLNEHAEKWQVFHLDGITPAKSVELPLSRATQSGEIVVNEEWLVKTCDGRDIITLCSAGPILNSEGEITGGIMAWHDITERKQMEQAIWHQAYHDLLTGLPNKMLYMDHLNMEIMQAHRHRAKVAVMFLDLDRFKNINDTLGHAVGDELLRQVATRLKGCIRESDTVARIGGDEFTILLSDLRSPEEAARVAEKILCVFQSPYLLENQEMVVSTSIGISIYPDDGEHAETLLKHADIAMYHAKGEGRDNFQFYDPSMNIQTLERMILENSLRQTLEKGELELYYQPQVDLRSRRVVSVEALLRWRHPEMGLLNPMQFIPLAEETGFIVPIDEWVLKSACQQNKLWQDAGFPRLSVTVNLSARQFHQPDLVQTVKRILDETGLDPRYLELEITEGTALRDVENTIPMIMQLKDLGVHFSIDDFGTGYSSLSYLKRLPIQKLKIDKSFISDITANVEDRAIVDAVITLAHTLKIKVIAEGVETEEQLKFLLGSGCDGIQGFLSGRPVPAETFSSMLARHEQGKGMHGTVARA